MNTGKRGNCVAFFSRLRQTRALTKSLGNGVWRRAHDRFHRSLDRVYQMLEGITDDQLHNRLMHQANELSELMPRIRTVCSEAHHITPSEDEYIPERTFDVHRALTKSAHDLASAAQVFAMTKLQAEAGQDVSNFAVETRVRIVHEAVEAAELALKRSKG